MELLIDTSTRYASVGLSIDGVTVAENTWRSNRNHSVELVPYIQTLMDKVGVELDELKAIFVAKGLGAFSALRVGISTAKTLAYSLKIPIVSINTLKIESNPYLNLGYRVNAIIKAGRNQVYIGRFGILDREEKSQYESISREQLSYEAGSALYCGEAIAELSDFLKQIHGPEVIIPCIVPPTRQIGMLAHLAYRKLQMDISDDPLTLEPLYLHNSQITVAKSNLLKK